MMAVIGDEQKYTSGVSTIILFPQGINWIQRLRYFLHFQTTWATLVYVWQRRQAPVLAPSVIRLIWKETHETQR